MCKSSPHFPDPPIHLVLTPTCCPPETWSYCLEWGFSFSFSSELTIKKLSNSSLTAGSGIFQVGIFRPCLVSVFRVPQHGVLGWTHTDSRNCSDLFLQRTVQGTHYRGSLWKLLPTLSLSHTHLPEPWSLRSRPQTPNPRLLTLPAEVHWWIAHTRKHTYSFNNSLIIPNNSCCQPLC